MHFLQLSKVAEDNLAKGDPAFIDKVGRTTGILRAKGIVPFRRATVNGRLHWLLGACLLYTSPSPRDATLSRMPSSA